MNRVGSRHATGPRSGDSAVLVIAGLTVLAVVEIADAAAHLAAHLNHRIAASWNPVVAALQLGTHKRQLPPDAAFLIPAAVIAAIIVLASFAIVILSSRPNERNRQLDARARLLGSGRDLLPMTHKQVAKTAERLGVDGPSPGLPVARSVVGGRLLYATFEEMMVVLGGPRRFKTTALAIPMMLAAPGAALATSNKPDLYVFTRLTREKLGGIWNLDPAGITGDGVAEFWWNPLSYLSLGNRPQKRAQELAGAFVDAYRHPDAKPDPFFDPKGEQLVANFLMAAWLDGRYLPDAYRWTTRPRDETPARILETHGRELPYASVMGEINAAPEQRSGIYGTAEKILQFLQEPEIAAWIAPSSGPRRPELDVAAFVRSRDTLYLHSQEGRGSESGLVTALTMAVCEHAVEMAKQSSGGRLRTPLVGVLDEACNICRWAALPSLYSHYGSRGIPLTILAQNWSQMAGVWGEKGAELLWSAANVKLYAGGVDEEPFLRRLESLIGEYNRSTSSVSHGGFGGGRQRSTSWQLTPTSILSVAELRALPKETHLPSRDTDYSKPLRGEPRRPTARGVVFASGVPPILIKPEYWWLGQHALEVSESKARYDRKPGAVDTPPANPWLTLTP
jgi:type IV secretory pathway TraG/TraD family ATPase VirD4